MLSTIGAAFCLRFLQQTDPWVHIVLAYTRLRDLREKHGSNTL
jgi:hypothetical protein